MHLDSKACKARKREVLLTKARSEEREHNLNVWTSSLNPNRTRGTPIGNRHGDRPTLRTRIFTKRSDRVPKKMRIWSKLSRPLTPAVVSEQPEKRAKIPAFLVNTETFVMMLQSDGKLETYPVFDVVALDSHEQITETLWSSHLGWVPKSILQEIRKEVTKLQQFETFEEVPQAEAEGQEIISSLFVDKWDESRELRSHLVS